MSVIVGLVVLIVAVGMREKIGWGTLANILFIGPWEDFGLYLIPPVHNNLVLQGMILVLSILGIGMASAIYIGVDAGAGPRDSLMLAVHRITGWSIRRSRGTIEVILVLVGWGLGGPAGVGTVVHALLIGPAVQWGFRFFKVQTSRGIEGEVS
jgi:uncharacterized membrane protein YczE